ncbi:hypothetical protein MXB_4337 [Myxobolus squamalis]|nr:hypothetical protein MXB_4337 [Myxobolus squamalis]
MYKTIPNQLSTLKEEEIVKKVKSTYDGGLVLEPKSGFYSNVILLLDYMSLYPSLIQEFNIDFTTMKFELQNDILVAVPIETVASPGVIPREIKKLVDRRKQVKSLIRTTDSGSPDYLQLDIRQRALKLIANSIYGCLGYSNSRFYAKPLAALITAKGRELLNSTKEMVEGMGYDVIYGDTDSIMVNTKIEDFVKAKEISQLSITLNSDGTLIRKNEIKGLDIIRHDWSLISKESGSHILELILSVNQHDFLIEKVQEYIINLNEQINSGKINIEKFVIKKNLAKRIDEYVDKKNQPHLLVAQRLMLRGKKVTVGDTIEYIVCLDGTTNSHVQRGYHVTEIEENGYPVDLKYYKEIQIFPVISRICEYIDGLDSSLLAECLEILSHKVPEPNSSKVDHEDIEKN